MPRILICLLVLLVVLGQVSPSDAHVLDANKATLSVKETNTYLMISVPVSTLNGFDDNADQLIDLNELGLHNGELRTQIERRVQVTADGAAPIESLTMVISALTGDDAPTPSAHVVAMIAHRFATAPQKVTVATDLFGTDTRDQRLAMTAQSGDVIEHTVFSPDTTSYTFFRGPLAVFGNFVSIGLSHILLGFDHLLFLLTILAAAMTARQWVIILTTFTIAHSITLTLATLQVMSVSSSIVEPLIAASIVALAVDNLVVRSKRTFAARCSIVFACGLLHGLGFASSLSDYGLAGSNLLPGLLGFNVGVELGQMVFVGAALVAVRVFNELSPRLLTPHRVAVGMSVGAIVPALTMVALRVLP